MITGDRVPGTGWTRPNDDARPNQRSSPRQRLISLRDAADILGLSVASVRRLISDGKLPALRLTRRLLVDVHDVERVIQELKARGPWP